MEKKNKLVGEIIAGIASTVVGGLVLIYITSSQFRLILRNLIEDVRLYFTNSTTIPNIVLWLLIIGYIALLTILGVYFFKNKKSRNSSAVVKQELSDHQPQEKKIAQQSQPNLSNLAQLDDKVKISATYISDQFKKNKTTTLSWREIFSLIAPFLLDHPNDYKMQDSIMPSVLFPGIGAKIDAQDYQTIKIQLIALGLIFVDYTKTTTGGMALFWTLTPNGKSMLLELRSVKKE